ncbi:uncharacterized protein LY89DRAFT_685152 [Mollisia scopiformis]|uniref:Uncharacterized protein n=1 Tax=Mollisia scopiformis TaxID=149040 RepID=A0A194XAN9_MOLSC|nr:uncharacterized protein LY89DRAFT_685152 [Mollisia scopiformis]KUJ17240.1 hypothetical protein LY89DRAFT_685152 [Mollisia scopiformis]
MLNTIVPGLVRRGFEAHASMTQNQGGGNDGEEPQPQFPVWGGIILVSTFILLIVVMFTIDYTFGKLVPTLIMIESPPESIGFEPLSTEDPDSTINKDPEELLVKPQPITSSFRRTLRHLGGFRARFRGILMYFISTFAIGVVGSILSAFPILSYIPRPFWNGVATVVCALLPLTWTHIAISQPSPKTWFRRIPSMKTWKKVAAPTAVLAVAEQLSVFLPVYLAMATGLTDKKPKEIAYMNGGQQTATACKGLGVLAFSLALSFLIVIPAKVTLVRVQASLLPDTDESSVPFDRSFGGKVVPEIVGGSGVIGMLDAWKTFDWASRIRLIKAYLKVFAMQVGVTVVFTICLIAEMIMIAGVKDWARFFPKDGDQQL